MKCIHFCILGSASEYLTISIYFFIFFVIYSKKYTRICSFHKCCLYLCRLSANFFHGLKKFWAIFLRNPEFSTKYKSYLKNATCVPLNVSYVTQLKRAFAFFTWKDTMLNKVHQRAMIIVSLRWKIYCSMKCNLCPGTSVFGIFQKWPITEKGEIITYINPFQGYFSQFLMFLMTSLA